MLLATVATMLAMADALTTSCSPVPFTCPAVIDGAVTINSCSYPVAQEPWRVLFQLMDRYSFVASAGDHVHITLTASQPMMIALVTTDGMQLASSGLSTAPVIEYAVPATGSIVIEVHGASLSATGPYHLSMTGCTMSNDCVLSAPTPLWAEDNSTQRTFDCSSIGAVEAGGGVAVTWSAVPGAAEYEYEVRAHASGLPPIIMASGTSSTTTASIPLPFTARDTAMVTSWGVRVRAVPPGSSPFPDCSWSNECEFSTFRLRRRAVRPQ